MNELWKNEGKSTLRQVLQSSVCGEVGTRESRFCAISWEYGTIYVVIPVISCSDRSVRPVDE